MIRFRHSDLGSVKRTLRNKTRQVLAGPQEKKPAKYSPVGQSADSIHNGDVLFRAASSAVRSLTLQHFRCSALTDRRGGPHG